MRNVRAALFRGLNRFWRLFGFELRKYRPGWLRLQAGAAPPAPLDPRSPMEHRRLMDLQRTALNEMAGVHRPITFDAVLADLERSGAGRLSETKLAVLKEVGIRDKAVAQLCCNNGRELVWIRNLGAGRCVGFDLSDEFIAQARRLAAAAKLDCEFVVCDLYEIPGTYDGQFDVLLITSGSLRCAPDVRGFMAVVARLLKPGGCLVMQEIHPFLHMLRINHGEESLVLERSYFDRTPIRDDRGLDYFRNRPYASSPFFLFSHTLTELFAALRGSGLVLRDFQESDRDVSAMFAYLGRLGTALPLSFVLVADKNAAQPAVE